MVKKHTALCEAQRKAIELRDYLNADGYQYDSEEGYATVSFEKPCNRELGAISLPIEYMFVEVEEHDDFYLLRTTYYIGNNQPYV